MASKISLREFQENVVARLQSAAAAGSSAVSSKLGVLVDNERWLIDLRDAGEVIPVPAMLPVPLTRSWFKGVANVRGVLYGVVDFAEFLGGAPTLPGVEARLLLVHPRFGINTGLLVRQMLGLKNPEHLTRQDDGEPLPPVAGVWRDPEGTTWKELDMQALLDQPEFLDIGT